MQRRQGTARGTARAKTEQSRELSRNLRQTQLLWPCWPGESRTVTQSSLWRLLFYSLLSVITLSSCSSDSCCCRTSSGVGDASALLFLVTPKAAFTARGAFPCLAKTEPLLSLHLFSHFAFSLTSLFSLHSLLVSQAHELGRSNRWMHQACLPRLRKAELARVGTLVPVSGSQ